MFELFSIDDRHPAMVRTALGKGASDALEIWNAPPVGLAGVLRNEPPGLCIGKVVLRDESGVVGVLGEPFPCEGGIDITQHGGWRAYTQQRKWGTTNGPAK